MINFDAELRQAKAGGLGRREWGEGGGGTFSAYANKEGSEQMHMLASYFITKTYLYNFDHLKPHFYKVKLAFTEVYTYFFLFLLKIYIVGTR